MKKIFHNFIDKQDNFGSQISSLIASKIWDREEEMFQPYSKFGNFSDLETVYMPKSSFGFGAVGVKNKSFDKIYSVRIYEKEIGK